MKIIAEIGVNHNGSLQIAKNLVSSAKECGADIVKFQTFKAKNNISKFAKVADYQKKIQALKNLSLSLLSNMSFLRMNLLNCISTVKN